MMATPSTPASGPSNTYGVSTNASTSDVASPSMFSSMMNALGSAWQTFSPACTPCPSSLSPLENAADDSPGPSPFAHPHRAASPRKDDPRLETEEPQWTLPSPQATPGRLVAVKTPIKASIHSPVSPTVIRKKQTLDFVPAYPITQEDTPSTDGSRSTSPQSPTASKKGPSVPTTPSSPYTSATTTVPVMAYEAQTPVHWSQPPASPPAIDGRERRFQAMLGAPSVNIQNLRRICWNGVPPAHRPLVWKLLLGYAPIVRERRESTLKSKRETYWHAAHRYFDVPSSERNSYEQKNFHQIEIDVPRTIPEVAFFHAPSMQRRLQRVLYVWTIRHPASGYVQGIADLLCPFVSVYLKEFAQVPIDATPEECEEWMNMLPEENLNDVEADAYFSMTLLMDHVHDNYITEQPGIQMMLTNFGKLVKTLDEPLSVHLENLGIPYERFAFRWMNCLLMREIHLDIVVRVWDAYISEGTAFRNLHVYVCAAFLLRWSNDLLAMDMEQAMMFLQNIPTSDWNENDIETLLSQAFVWLSLYEGSRQMNR